MGTIACTCQAIGSLGKLLSEETGSAPRTFSASSIRHEFMYEDVGTERIVQHTNAITGNLSKFSSGVRKHSYLTQGTISVQASPSQLGTWLPRIFGGPTAGTDIPLSNNLPTFDLLVFRENGIFQYTDCLVAQAVLRGRTSNGGEADEFIELIVSVVGKEERIDAVTWPDPEPALATTQDYLPYAFWESSLTLNSNAIDYETFSLSVNNNLMVKFFNNLFPDCIRSTGRDIGLIVQAPFTCDDLDYAMALHEDDGTGEFKLETPTDTPVMSTTFTFPALRNAFQTPTIPGKAPIPIRYGLEAYRTSAAAEVTITHDQTP